MKFIKKIGNFESLHVTQDVQPLYFKNSIRDKTHALSPCFYYNRMFQIEKSKFIREIGNSKVHA